MATDGGLAQFWGDTSLRADEVERVRAGICARFDGEAREELLGMLLEDVQVNDKTEGTTMNAKSKHPENLEPLPKTKRGPTSPPASGRTPAELAEIRTWAHANGLNCADRGRVPASILAAYDAREAEASSPEDPADDTHRENPPALSEPERAAVAEAIHVAVVHGEVVPDMETRAKLFNDGFHTADAQYTRLVDELIAEANAAEIALDLTLRKWGEERARAAARKTLIIDLSAQVIAAEHERRADGELIASMDRALRDAQDVIEDLRRQLAKAGAGRSWWRAAS